MEGPSRPPGGARSDVKRTSSGGGATSGETHSTVRRDARPVQGEGFEVFREPDGCVVHQPALDKVHFLNHTAAFVLELCTGRHTVGEIEEILAGFFEMTEPAEDAVAAALRQLEAEGLVRIP